MSGLEFVGAAASVAGLLEFAVKLSTVVKDVIHAKDEKQRFKKTLDNLEEQLRALQKFQQDAQGYPEELYFISLFEERKGGQPKSGDQRGALFGMAEAMKEMQYKLRERSSFRRRVVRLKWTLDKQEVQALLSEVQEWRSQIHTVMQQDQLRLTMKSLKLEMDTNTRVRKTESVTAEVHGAAQGIALQSDKIADRTQRIEAVGEDSNDRLKSIQADSLALRLRKDNKDKRILHEAIAHWLSSLDFNARHTEIYERCIDVSQEFIDSEEFQAWRSGRPWILFCWADAGAGKTMLSSVVIEHLRAQSIPRTMPVLCMYLNHKERNTHNPRTLIGSLLRQLVQYGDYSFCSDELIRRFKEKPKGTSLSRRELQEAFCSEITHYERVFVVVDALDESSDEVRRFYQDIVQRLPLGRLCVMITSRREPPNAVRGIRCDVCKKGPFNIFFRCEDCSPVFDVCHSCRDQQKNCGDPVHRLTEPYEHAEVYKQIDPSDKAIAEYVKREIHGDVQTHRFGRADLGLYQKEPGTTLIGRLCRKDAKLEATISETVCARAGRKFLLAKLYIESLRLKLNKREITDALRALPPEYAGVYETTMERIKAYSVNEPRSSATHLALATLSWIVYTHRPLDLAELQHALAIKLSSDFSEEDIYDEEELLEKTAGLISLGSHDGAVKVSHYTVQEYFMNEGKHWLLQDAHIQIARACLHYMSNDDLSEPCDSSQEDKAFEKRRQRYPFLCYAYEYWGYHARDANSDPETKADVLRFLRDPARVATFVQAMWYLKSAESAKWEIRRGATALHITAWFGLTDVLADLVDLGLSTNAKDPFHEQTPLIYASRRGHSDTVAKLIELGVFVNSRSARGRTALVEAVSEGHLPVVEVLLKQYNLAINHILPWEFGRSVLMLAVINNNLEIVNSLLLGRRDISINQKDSRGYTALMLATSFGFVDVVERLLAHPDVDVDVTSRYGTSALFHAATCEKEPVGRDIAELLLDHDIDTSIQDRRGGGTALVRAVDYGNLLMVETLLNRGVSIRQTDHQDRGLLHAAAVNDRCDIAAFLIEKGIPVSVQDKQRRTPLHDAGRFGNVAMIHALLERGANIQLQDSSGRTPSTVAWQNGKIAAFELLKKKSVEKGYESDTAVSDPEQLPVWSLAKLGRGDIIEQRIAQRSRDPFALSHLDPDTEDTPIHCAIGADQPSILRLLLLADLSPDTQNASFRSPLHQAAVSPSITLMQTLLEARPNLNKMDETGSTPLFLAYTSSRPLNALLLVEAGAEIEEKALILPLFFKAIDYERLAAVKILMKKHKAPILAKNQRGESALQIAKARGLVEIQKLLDGNKSYANNRSLAVDEGEELDLAASVRGPFTRPEVWEEEENEQREEKVLRMQDFPAVSADDVGGLKDKFAVEEAPVSR